MKIEQNQDEVNMEEQLTLMQIGKFHIFGKNTEASDQEESVDR